MTAEVFIPKLGQTVEEVTLVKWLVGDGSTVVSGQEILEVETDKAVFPVEANGKGILHRGPFQEGQVIPVLTVVAVIGTPNERFSQGKLFASPRARRLAGQEGVDLRAIQPSGYGGERIVERDVQAFLEQQQAAPEPARISPLAQRMAAAEGVDTSRLVGSGNRGRIVREDVARALVNPPVVAEMQEKGEELYPRERLDEVTERIPLKGVRGLIAERMDNSVHTTARVTLMTEVDATELVAARSRIKAKVEKEWGFAPGYNDLLARVVIQALKRFPYMNARLSHETIEILRPINLGMAVDTDRGLLVLVIKDAGQKDLRQFGDEFRQFVDHARVGKVLPDDLTGGTFTITNLGMYDIDAFTPVINLPEVAILGVGRIAPKPVVIDNAVVVRQMMTLSLAFDHRLVDGAPAARFLQYIKQLVEEPYLMLAG